MLFPYQRTFKESFSFQGIGVHSGETITVKVEPAECNEGITFHDEASGIFLKNSWQHVSQTQLSTTITYPNKKILSTIEHLLAAFAGLGIVNAKIKVRGSEIPIFDGSALPFINMIENAGIKEQSAERKWVVIKNEIVIKKGESTLTFQPSQCLCISMRVLLHENIQHYSTFNPNYDVFKNLLAPARTFAQLKDITQMRKAGFIKGGSLNSALVLHEGKPVNAQGFRIKNECSNHKILDILGDFFLTGTVPIGTITGHASGHTLNHLAIKVLMQNKKAFQLCSSSEIPWLFKKEKKAIKFFSKIPKKAAVFLPMISSKEGFL